VTEAASGFERASVAERTSRPRWAALLLPALVASLAWVVLYLPSLDYPFVWTDEGALAGGAMLRPAGETLAAFREPLHRIEHRGASARQAYYRPLPVVALSLVNQNFGREPRNFRRVTHAVGAVCIAAFGLFAGWLFGRAGPALFAALFVALHPVGIEATVWISGVPATTCALFVIGALWLALASPRAPRSSTAVAWGALSLAALALGLLSKERAVVEPALLLAALVSLNAGRRGSVAAGLVLAHALLVAGYLFWLRPAVLGSTLAGLPPIGGSATTQILTAVASWPRQLAWLFVPVSCSTSDAVRVVESLADPWLWLGALLALGSVVGWWALLRARAPVAALGLAWIWIAFAPTAGLMPMLHAAGERYLFLSTLGASLLLGGLGARFLHGERPPWRRAVAPVAALLALAGLAGRTHLRLPEWSSTRALFESDVARDPAYREAYFVLGLKAFESGRFAEAEDWIDPLLEGDSRFDGTASYLNWLSLAELACNNKIRLQDFEGILALEARWRRDFVALARAPTFRICFALAHDGLGLTEEAVRIYLAVARELGSGAPPRLYLMIARDLAQLGRLDEARSWLAKARRFGSHDPALQREVEAFSSYLDQTR
jgi:tetratricopeptide (TPR) repeat protein